MTVAARLPCDARAPAPVHKLGPAGLWHMDRPFPGAAALLGVTNGEAGQNRCGAGNVPSLSKFWNEAIATFDTSQGTVQNGPERVQTANYFVTRKFSIFASYAWENESR